MSAKAPQEDFVTMPPPSTRRIFVNRNLRMDTVKAVGFDMDYTLARYHLKELEELAYRLTRDKLLARGYPEEIGAAVYNSQRVIRGLTVDKQNGNILKLDRHNHASRVVHGHRPLSKSERRSIYRRERIEFVPPRFALVDTFFSLPEMCLYADLIQLLSDTGRKVDPWKLFDDIREAIDECHRDNSLKSQVMADVPRFVDKDPLLARTLHKLRSSGKKLFLLTNSFFPYSNALMSYLLNDELGEYPTWQSYFELVIVGSRKPEFFTSTEPFAELDHLGEIVTRPARRLRRGRVYQGGNLAELEKALRHRGEDIIYVGDHIYGDILKSKKSSLWRTALVVEEIEEEMQRTAALHDEMETLADLEMQRRELDDLVNQQRRHLTTLDAQDGKATADYIVTRKERDKNKQRLRAVLRKRRQLARTVEESFNKTWGMVFKEEHENSRFGEQVASYACIYTSRVSNFLYYSAYQYFRSPRDFLPHERFHGRSDGASLGPRRGAPLSLGASNGHSEKDVGRNDP